MIGNTIDARYEVLERIGDGTFFSVFKAQDRVLNRLVTVKILFPRYAAHAEFASRLRAQMSAVSALNHPTIARVYESGESGSTIYVASEHVRGTDLKERVRKSAPLPFSEAVDIAIRVAEGLDFAHRAGFVHGDVTPHNVLISPEMDVKITDFGVSQAAVGSALVQANAMLRGVNFVAPEGAQGLEPTPASDTYALGVILFEMLTGALPYNGDTPLAVALKHAQEPVPSTRSLNPSVPRALDGIIAKALSKDPAARYPSALAMIRDLRRANECQRQGRPLSSSPLEAEETEAVMSRSSKESVDSSRRDGWRIAVTLLLLVVTALFGILVLGVFTRWGIPKDVTVPNIIGKSRAEAQAQLQEAGLRMKVVGEQFSDKYPADAIMDSTPGPGRQTKEKREINVLLSRGPEMVTVPDVRNTSEREARRVLVEARLQVGTIRHEYSDVVPRSQVAAQQPASGQQAPKNSKVDLTFSRGPYVTPDTPEASPDVPPPAQPPANVPAASTPDRPARPQRWDISVEVPAEGGDEQTVRITVVQDGQETERLKESEPAGDIFERSVETTGSATIRVYINDRLIREEQVPAAE